MSGVLRSLFLVGVLLVHSRVASAQTFATTMVPTPPSTASGQGILTLGQDHTLSFDITISGLHGGEIEASLHGPAPAGSETPVLFRLPLGDSKIGRVGPLTSSQVEDLEAGLWYVRIHSSHHPDGEIQGQIRGALAVESDSWGSVKARYRGR